MARRVTSIIFVSGPALGHLVRVSQVIAHLRALMQAQITVVYPDLKPLPAGLFDPACELLAVPVDDANPDFPAPEFGNALEGILARISPDVIVHDCDPLRWLSTTRFPDCPRICITNAFLVTEGARQTQQDINFTRFAAAINAERVRKGLPALGSAREPYHGDLVLLADPGWIAGPYDDLPSDHVACGAAYWTPEGEVPAQLAALDSILLCSMGSTGQALSDRFCLLAARKAGCRDIVRVHSGNDGVTVRQAGRYRIFDCGIMPLDSLLTRARLVVTQGGAGSTYQALEAGNPVLVMPTHRNHAILGHMLEELGVGRCVPSFLRLLTMPAKAIAHMRQTLEKPSAAGAANAGAQRMAERIAAFA